MDVVVFGVVLDFSTIYYWCVFVWGVLCISGVGGVVFHSKVCNVVIHGEEKRALGVNGVVVTLNIHAII